MKRVWVFLDYCALHVALYVYLVHRGLLVKAEMRARVGAIS